MVRNYITKEKCVVDEIRDAFPGLFWTFDSLNEFIALKRNQYGDICSNASD